MHSTLGKRSLDIIFGALAAVCLFPLMVMLAVLIRVTIGAPVVFRQLRPGLHGKPFTAYKFRTMTSARDAQGNLLPDKERLTSLGKFLRSTSLDELPAIFNVLKGEMSLVGPRPLLMRYLDRYTPQQARRHNAKPGISGWAQVNGRNAITWEDKFKLDVWYVDNLSLWLDVKILVLTAWKVLKMEGISQPGQATMEEFLGSQEERL
jgi:sugar transferase EpsL